MDNRGSSAIGGRTGYVLVVIAAVLVSAVLVPVVWEETSGPDDAVAVVSIDRTITSSTVDALEEDLREARQNETVKAVVLKVDSPGGSAAASERLYLAVQRTVEADIPVVASVQATGASGAYYAMLPAERIYTMPSSMVGSVGVRATKPAPPYGNEIRTGPDKASGTMEQRREQVETLRRMFVGSVMKHRGDDLNISREEVSHAKVYVGPNAVENGMADRIGTQSDAIEYAADQAGLDSYAVVEKEPPTLGGIILLGTDSGQPVVVKKSPVGYDGVDAGTPLMVYGEVQYQDEVITNGSA